MSTIGYTEKRPNENCDQFLYAWAWATVYPEIVENPFLSAMTSYGHLVKHDDNVFLATGSTGRPLTATGVSTRNNRGSSHPEQLLDNTEENEEALRLGTRKMAGTEWTPLQVKIIMCKYFHMLDFTQIKEKLLLEIEGDCHDGGEVSSKKQVFIHNTINNTIRKARKCFQ